jgi:hypothetical protein
MFGPFIIVAGVIVTGIELFLSRKKNKTNTTPKVVPSGVTPPAVVPSSSQEPPVA